MNENKLIPACQKDVSVKMADDLTVIVTVRVSLKDFPEIAAVLAADELPVFFPSVVQHIPVGFLPFKSKTSQIGFDKKENTLVVSFGGIDRIIASRVFSKVPVAVAAGIDSWCASLAFMKKCLVSAKGGMFDSYAVTTTDARELSERIRADYSNYKPTAVES